MDIGVVVRGRKKPSRASVSEIICILLKKSVAVATDQSVYIPYAIYRYLQHVKAAAKDVRPMNEKTNTQINIADGYVVINDTPEGKHTLGICNMTDKVGASIEATSDNIIDIRAMLWDAIRKQGRGFEINIEDVLKIEEVRHKGRYSVTGYKEEINWTIDLLQRHLTRIEGWEDTPAEGREIYGKLDEFLSQFEEM